MPKALKPLLRGAYAETVAAHVMYHHRIDGDAPSVPSPTVQLGMHTFPYVGCSGSVLSLASRPKTGDTSCASPLQGVTLTSTTFDSGGRPIFGQGTGRTMGVRKNEKEGGEERIKIQGGTCGGKNQ